MGWDGGWGHGNNRKGAEIGATGSAAIGAYAEQSPQGGDHDARSRRRSCRSARPGAARRRAADLVVWWEKGFYPQEDAAVAEIIAAFEQKTGKQVELVQPTQNEISKSRRLRSRPGSRPTSCSAFGSDAGSPGGLTRTGSSTSRASSPRSWTCSMPTPSKCPPCSTARRADAVSTRCRWAGIPTTSMSGTASWSGPGSPSPTFPSSGRPFWSFWCDQVQPAVRKALGRDDIWGVGLPMSAAAHDTDDELLQFELAYGTPWLDRDRRPQIDDPAVRAGIIRALEAYTAIWRKGCTPPDSTSWTNIGNNKAFLAQTVVMTVKGSLSIPGALRTARPDDYYKNAATIDWPDGANGQPLVIVGAIPRAVVFKAGRNPALAEDFVRFLAEEGWLAHWLDFAGDRFIPPMRKLVEQPFWLDPSDPHRMRAAIQILTQPH